MFDFTRYITIQGFDLLDFIIPQQKKLVGIRAETQIALDALEFSKRDRLQAEDSLTTALAKAGTRRTKEARGGDEAQGTLYVKSVFIVHVGCTRCVTFSTANNMKIHVRITLTVECIRTCIFLFLFYV